MADVSISTNDEDQRHVHQGRVLIVGVGGLGCPAALQLATAGVGTIGLIDPDAVERSNLNRQILHTEADIGRAKVDSARAKVLACNPAVTVHTFNERLTAANLARIFADFDFVIDATDNVVAKFLINDGAVLTGTPYSHAGVVGFLGQTMTVLPHHTACLRCVFPAPPTADVPTCQEAGILGAVAGTIGCVQAGEAIKFLSGLGELISNRLLTFDALAMRWRSVPLRRNRRCPLCGEQPSVTSLSAEAA
ncbi:MAG TPA: HesA/MoeB/ThiF family protein [Candidatus Binatia bacterium]|nr:HesA/MoeB/ThiF family protein [Candidatus Binatia bacterium]